MSPELDRNLCENFPNLYRDRNGDKRETCMVWGFPGDGWFKIIYDLSVKLEGMILKLPEAQRADYRASQVKEKMGTLCYYVTCTTPEINAAIQKAEKASETTCEECGQPGVLREGSWLRTLCKKHADGRKPFRLRAF